jgi:lysozyme family protein
MVSAQPGRSTGHATAGGRVIAMPDPDFAKALRFCLKWEGGYVNNPSDHGGPTNQGVTQKVYDDWRAHNGQPARDVKGITADEVRAIYQQDYWTPACCMRIQARLDIAQFDTAVNMGSRRAILILQEAVGTPADGEFGAGTERACAMCDLGVALHQYCDIREGLYRHFAKAPGQAKFLQGWLRRLNDLRHEVGLPGFESTIRPDFSSAGFMARIPDLPPGAALEDWR